jgi:hypothetical protein
MSKKLKQLEAEKWELAEAMDKAPNAFTTGIIMMKLNDVLMQIYYEQMRLDGYTHKQAKKELWRVLEESGFKYAEEVKAIA